MITVLRRKNQELQSTVVQLLGQNNEIKEHLKPIMEELQALRREKKEVGETHRREVETLHRKI